MEKYLERQEIAHAKLKSNYLHFYFILFFAASKPSLISYSLLSTQNYDLSALDYFQ